MIVEGFVSILTFNALALILIGVIVGIIFGAIPGLTTAMGIVLCLPLTFSMTPIMGMSLLIGLYIGGFSGGLITAILLKIPGTPASIATTFDGYPMAQNGDAGKALGLGVVFSFLGGMFSLVFLISVSPYIAEFAIKFGAYEYFALSFFALTMIASVAGDSLIKGLMSGIIGMIIAMVGSAPIDGYPRLTLGFHMLDGGFEIVPVIIGLFAVAELIKSSEKYEDKLSAVLDCKIKGFGFSLNEFKAESKNLLRSSSIGTAIGILPGIGGSLASLLAYSAAKNSADKPEEFGTGVNAGVVASESANNAAIGGALIPLLALGIPGDTVTALLLGALTMHGITPGPLLFATHGNVVYGIFAALIIANIFMLIVEFFGMRIFIKLLKIPKYILLPIIISMCVIGSFGLNNRVFDVVTIFIFGIFGYFLTKAKLPVAPVILGFILGPIAELNLRRGLMYGEGDFFAFFHSPIAALFIILGVLSIIWSGYKNFKLK